MKNIFAGLFLFVCFSCNHKPKPIITGFEGKPIPHISILLVDSTTTLDLAKVTSNKSVALVFFSPTCPYCKKEIMSILNSAATNKEIEFYLFTSLPFNMVKDIYEHLNLNKYQNVTMGYDYENAFVPYFKVGSIPFTTVFKEGKLYRAFGNEMTYSEIINAMSN